MNNHEIKNEHFKVIPRWRIILGIAILAFSVILVLTVSSRGRNPRQVFEITELQELTNITVIAVFDIEETPSIQFISPDGNYVDMRNIRYRKGSNFIQYFLPHTATGVWKVAYDQANINFVYEVYEEHIFIRDFWANRTEDEYGQIPASFFVSSDDTTTFVYRIYGVVTAPDNSIDEKTLLLSGVGITNQLITKEFCVASMQGGFMLLLEVNQDGLEDSAWMDLRLGT